MRNLNKTNNKLHALSVLILFIFLALPLSLCDAFPVFSAPGDFLRVETNIKNLTSEDGKLVELEAVYTPKSYKLSFYANGGQFEGGETTEKIEVIYNDGSLIYDELNTSGNHLKVNESFIKAPKPPVRSGYSFACWYLKGNNIPKDSGEDDGVIVKDRTRYMIANDDQSDLAKTETDKDGDPIAKALWIKNSFSLDDGNEADKDTDKDPEGDLQEGSDSKGLWDENNKNNQVVEYIKGLPYKADYEEIYGDITYQYKRIAFNAELSNASSYRWFVKRAGNDSFVQLSETGPVFLADELTRSNNEDVYRAEVFFDDEAAVFSLETKIKVFWLPAINKTKVIMEADS